MGCSLLKQNTDDVTSCDRLKLQCCRSERFTWSPSSHVCPPMIALLPSQVWAGFPVELRTSFESYPGCVPLAPPHWEVSPHHCYIPFPNWVHPLLQYYQVVPYALPTTRFLVGLPTSAPQEVRVICTREPLAVLDAIVYHMSYQP